MVRASGGSVCALLAGLGLASCDGSLAPAVPAAKTGWFVDGTAELGLPVAPARPSPSEHFMPDSLSGGGAFVDYDRDGDLDLYVVRGAYAPARGIGGPESENRLYRQEADGRFTDVSAAAGADDAGYGMGVAVGDIDNDGFPDLFVANYGPDVLLHNNGDGTFTDVTLAAGVGDPRWGTSAGFLDYDGDGFLDLFIANYVDYALDRRTVDIAGRPEYPGPDCCDGVPSTLYHNEGNGTFTDVSQETGIAARAGKGLGVAFHDLDRDGRIDIYVANDREPNFAWIQQPDGTFVERAATMGLAVNGYGDAQASMGIATGDANGDGQLDLFVTNLFGETNTLYVGAGPGQFDDATVGSGLGPPSFDFTGFGAAFFDPDLDGDLDLVVANGRVLRSLPRPGADLGPHWTRYAEESQLYENEGAGSFRAAPELCGAPCSEPGVGRGLALGDLDDDGDHDLLLLTGDGRARVFRNERSSDGRWIGLRAVDGSGRIEALGARVVVHAGGRAFPRDVAPASSYLASHDPRVIVGLGSIATVDDVVVRWPDGAEERFGPLAVGRYHDLARGSGR